MTHVQVSDVEVVSLAGNNIDRLSSDVLTELRYTKRLDLRMNELTLPTTDTLKFAVLERLTHLDVRDNHIGELDLHVLRSLEYLNCERNSMVSLHLSGTSLRSLSAARNRESLAFFNILLCSHAPLSWYATLRIHCVCLSVSLVSTVNSKMENCTTFRPRGDRTGYLC